MASRPENKSLLAQPLQDEALPRNFHGTYKESKREIEPSEVTEIIPCEFDNQINLLNEAYLLVCGGSTNLLGSSNLTEIETPMKNTVLHIAASYGKDDIVNLVIERAPKLLFTFNKNNDSALHVAARGGHISTVKTLLASYTNIERHDIKMAWLEYTNSWNDVEDYDEVLNMEDLLCFVNKENVEGNTMLHEAMLRGKRKGGDEIFNVCELYKTEDWLGNSLANCCYEFALDIANLAKKSVLYLAVENQDKDAVELIVKKSEIGAKPEGLSPVVASIMKKNQGMLSIILENKPTWIHLRDKDKRLPLHYAASMGYLKGVELLLAKCKCCTIQRDKYGYFPIHLASSCGHVEVVKKLLEYCPDLTEMLDTSLHQNILHIAAHHGRTGVIRYILESEVPERRQMINQKDRNGEAPLHLAARSFYCKTLIYISHQKHEKVHLNMVNQNNETALDIFNSHFKHHNSALRKLTFTALINAGAKHSPRSSVQVYIESIPSDSNSPEKTEQDKDNKQEHEEIQQSERKQSNENSTKTDQQIKRKELHQRSKEKQKEKEKGLDRYRDKTEKVPCNTVPENILAKGSNPSAYKDIVETLILVSTLIVTASVAACFAVPGEAEGKAHNLYHAMFQAFIIFITISLFSSISSIIILFWAKLGLTELVPFILQIVMPLIGIALISLSLAFMAGLYTVISELTWLANLFLAVTVIFVVAEILLYMILFLPLPAIRNSSRYHTFLYLAWLADD